MNTDFVYICAAILLVFGVQRMGKIATARQGNCLSAIGMILALFATLWAYPTPHGFLVGTVALAGACVGYMLAMRVQMTAMPELVALFNGFGGLASWAIGLVEGLRLMRPLPEEYVLNIPNIYCKIAQFAYTNPPFDAATYFEQIAICLAIIIGGITFTGSLIAYGKLSRKLPSRSITFEGLKLFDGLLLAALIFGSYQWLGPRVLSHTGGDTIGPLIGIAITSLIAGGVLTMHIGGGDMPVIIALLNSLSGVAACAAGLISLNKVLIVAGCLVGTSGIILTLIMCKAMNRSIRKVLFAGFENAMNTTKSSAHGDPIPITIEDAFYPLEAARTVAIVPGYGLAVAQAQHAIKELAQKLMERGAEVFYAIHPVAGRMPGHMNVLLAEADVDYDQLVELKTANERFQGTDVALVVGANDVVNPAAIENPDSPLYGMPVLEVFRAKTVFVLKRSRDGKGFSGFENELFTKENTRMLYGDAKATLTQLTAAFKE